MSVARLHVVGHPVVEVASGTSLLVACEQGGVPMTSECGGFAACNSCRVVVVSGAEHLSPVQDDEEAFLDRPDHRLGCQANLRGGDVHVRLDPG
jgi:2Fe-2S ferredoxin